MKKRLMPLKVKKMNSKEISEIKKLFTQDKSAVSRICGCYVDGEKNKVTEFKEAFLALPEEELFKYFSIFKKTLSGSLGKNLLNMEFPLEEELEGGKHELLMKLRETELKDDEVLHIFYDRVIESYDTADNYLILLIHQAYDVPGRTSDNLEMEDASEEVFSHILCCICPVSLSKPGLSYYASEGCFRNRVRDWVVDMPSIGFLFPAFNDRSTDIHSLLYYTAKPDELRLDFAEPVLGCNIPMSAGNQRDTFNSVIEEALGEECGFEVVKNIHEIINEKIEQTKEEPEPLSLNKEQVKQILSDSGVDNEKLKRFEECYVHQAGETTPLQATNIVETRKFEVKSLDVVVKVKPDRTDLVGTRVIDGIPYLLIQLSEDVEVNGIPVKMPRPVGYEDGRAEAAVTEEE